MHLLQITFTISYKFARKTWTGIVWERCVSVSSFFSFSRNYKWAEFKVHIPFDTKILNHCYRHYQIFFSYKQWIHLRVTICLMISPLLSLQIWNDENILGYRTKHKHLPIWLCTQDLEQLLSFTLPTSRGRSSRCRTFWRGGIRGGPIVHTYHYRGKGGYFIEFCWHSIANEKESRVRKPLQNNHLRRIRDK